MKIWLNENYNILKSDNNNIFGKGNNLNDRVEVLLPTASVIADNVVPTFKFRLASNRTLGAFYSNETSYEFDDEYTAFPFVLNDTILSVKGDLEITIELQFYNELTQLVRTKNVTAKAIVTDNIVLNDEIYIVGNEGEIVEAVRENMDALNARQTALETTLVNNETIDVDRVNGIIYGKQFYPKASVSNLGNFDKRFANAYINVIVDSNHVAHDTKDILDTGKITYTDSPAIDSSRITIGTFTFGNVSFSLYVPTNMITAPNKTAGKGYLVAVDGQGTPTNTYSNENVYIENGALNAPKVATQAINDTPITDFVKLENGIIPSAYLPSYVDDVLEYSAKSSFPTTGETGKIYVDTSTNLTYRWGGSTYVEISKSLTLGTTSSTAFAGDRGLALEKEVASLKNDKQDKLIAGDGITISIDGTISINYPNGDDLTYGE